MVVADACVCCRWMQQVELSQPLSQSIDWFFRGRLKKACIPGSTNLSWCNQEHNKLAFLARIWWKHEPTRRWNPEPCMHTRCTAVRISQPESLASVTSGAQGQGRFACLDFSDSVFAGPMKKRTKHLFVVLSVAYYPTKHFFRTFLTYFTHLSGSLGLANLEWSSPLSMLRERSILFTLFYNQNIFNVLISHSV